MSVFTRTSPTSNGLIPDGFTEIGGVVLDLVGVNGTRVTSQLAASSLFVGRFSTGSPAEYRGNPGTIGIQTGFSDALVSALGGGLAEVAVRLSVVDGDTSPGDFDFNQNKLLLNGIEIGDFSAVLTQVTTSDGETVFSTVNGFSNETLNTGWFYSTDSTFLQDFYNTLSTGEVSFQLRDLDPNDNVFDFRQGIDGSIIDVGSGPNVDPSAVDDVFELSENGVLTGDVLADNGNGVDADPDGDIISVTQVNGSASDVGQIILLASGASLLLNSDGTFEYDPGKAFDSLPEGGTATDSFTYQLQDRRGGSDTATVTFTIIGTNDAPVARANVYSGTEDGLILGNVIADDTGDGSDIDADQGDSLTVRAINGAEAVIGSEILLPSGAELTLNEDGSFSYDPTLAYGALGANVRRDDSFEYTVQDEAGAISTATITLSIFGQNDAPRAADDSFATTDVDGVSGNVLANNGSGMDADPDTIPTPDVLRVVAVNGQAADVGVAVDLPGGGRVTLTAQGALDFDPDGDFTLLGGQSEDVGFSYTIQDTGGLQSSATVTITVTGIGSAPDAQDDEIATVQGEAVLADLLADNGNGADTDADGDTIRIVAVNGAQANVGVPFMLPSGAMLTVLASGGANYDPNGAFDDLGEGVTATDSFSYVLDDGQARTATDTATATVTITGENDAPDARDDAARVSEDGTAAGNLFDDTGNGADTDVDGDATSIASVNGDAQNVGVPITLASGARLTVNADGSYVYDPDSRFESLSGSDSATDSFTYTVTDGSDVSGTAIMTITVQGQNDAPVALDDAAQTFETKTVTGSVLTNDSDVDAGDVLSVSAVNGDAAAIGTAFDLPSGARVTMQADGTYVYDPNGAFDDLANREFDTDSFTYEVIDGEGGNATATLVLIISGAGSAPVATEDAYVTDEDTAFSGNVVSDDTGNGVDADADGDLLVVTEVEGQSISDGPVTLVSGAVVAMASDGSFTYDPAGAQDSIAQGGTRQDTFTYTIDDGFGGTDTSAAIITISGVNDAPIATDDSYSVLENETLSGNVLTDDTGSGPDTDVDGGALTVVGVNGNAAVVGAPIFLSSGARLTLNQDGGFEYDPNGVFADLAFGEAAQDTFSYTISDGQGGTATAIATVNIDSTDGAPNFVVSEAIFGGGRTEEWLSVSYRVENLGGDTPETTWTDYIYLSADEVLDDTDILLRQTDYTGPLAAGSFYEKALTVKMPGTPGDYFLIVQADGDDVVLELDEEDNVGLSSDAATVTPAYTVSLFAGVGEVVSGEAFTISGQALDTETGAAAAFEFVTVEATLDGLTRNIDVFTDINGFWSLRFASQAESAGVLELSARHPGNEDEDAAPEALVNVYGMGFAQDFQTFDVIYGEMGIYALTLENFGDLDLTGIEVSIEGLPPSWEGSAQITETVLGGDGALEVTLEVTLPDPTIIDFDDIVVRATSDQGAEAVSNLRIDAVVSLADINIEEGSLRAFALRGEQEFISFTVTNDGATASAPITVILPDLDWIDFVSPQLIDSLAPGDSTTVTLSLMPDETVPIGEFNGSIGVAEANGDTEFVSFDFFTASDAKGTLALNFVDELFYFSAEAPKVDDCKVVITNAVTGQVLFSGKDVDDMLTLEDVPEGYYNIFISADNHDSYRSTVLIEPGQVNEINAFMSRETVKYYWSVTEIEIEDRYEVQVEAEFETDVPVPVVVIDPPVIDVNQLEFVGQTMTVELTATNHGFIAVNDFLVQFGDHPFYEFVYPESALATLDAKSSVTIPIQITRVADFDDLPNEAAPPSPSEATGSVPCVIGAFASWTFPCGPEDVNKTVSIGISNVVGNCGRGDPAGFATSYGRGLGDGTTSTVPTILEVDACDLIEVITNCGRTFFPQYTPVFDFIDGAATGDFGPLLGSVASAAEGHFDPDVGDTLDDARDRLDSIGNGLKCARALANIIGWEEGTDFLDDIIQTYDGITGIAGLLEAGSDIDDLLDGPEDLVDLIDLVDDLLELNSTIDNLTNAVSPDNAAPPMSFEQLAASNNLSTAQLGLSLSISALEAAYAYQSYIYGDSKWVDLEDLDGAYAFFALFGQFSAEDSQGGVTVTAGELTALLEQGLPEGITGTDANRFIERWNNTVLNWNAGILTDADAVSLGTTNFVAADVLEDLASRYAAHQLIADAHGYSNLTDFTEIATNLAEAEQNIPSDGVCATVRISISQDVVMTRQAFLAELEIVNELDSTLEDIGVTLLVRDGNGNLVAQNTFGITDPDLNGLSAIDGTGSIAGGATGRAEWTLVPSRLAAADSEQTYTVSGSLTYSEEGVAVTIPLAAEEITVRPQAELELDYFLQRNVVSDDPFTDDVVEESEPFALGVLVNNVGAGDARNLSITAAQPRIIDNEKGLLIDFEVIGSEVNGESVRPTLKADFGDVAAGDTEVAIWSMKSSLQGKFVDYDVSFTHLNSLGIEELSLITQTRVHELIQVVRDDRDGTDGLSDFLVNEDWETDASGIPDALYTSEMEVLAVAQATGETSDGAPVPGDLSVTITADMAQGYSYVSLLDPGAGSYGIASIIRDSDGKELLSANYWQTDRTFPANGRPVYENVLHVLDHNAAEGNQSYTVIYDLLNEGPLAQADAFSTNEDTRIIFDVLSNDIDPEGDALSITAVSQGAHGEVRVGSARELVYTPNLNFAGQDRFTYTVSDTFGNAAIAEVLMTVAEVADTNDTVGISVGLTSPDEAGFAPKATSSADELNDGAQRDIWFTVTRSGDLNGRVTVDLARGGSAEAGSDTIMGVPQSVTLSAGQSVAHFRVKTVGDFAVEGDETIEVAITGTNRADVLVDADASTATHTIENDDFGSTLSVAVDTVAPGAPGANPSATASAEEGDSPSNGTAAWFVVTRTGDLSGAVSVALAYGGTAGSGDRSSVLPAQLELGDGEAFGFVKLDVLGDTSVEEDETVEVSLVSTNRSDVTIDGAASAATFTILNDDAPNAPPVGEDDIASTDAGQPVSIEVLDNDTDPDGDALVVTVVGAPENGTAVVADDGTLIYSPDAGFTGVDGFAYGLGDGRGGAAAANVTVTVAPVGLIYRLGSAEADTLAAVPEGEYFDTRDGADVITGTPQDLSGDVFRDFSALDVLQLQDAPADRLTIEVTPGGTEILFATPQDADFAQLSLEGDYTGTGFSIFGLPDGSTEVRLISNSLIALTEADDRFFVEGEEVSIVEGFDGDDVIYTGSAADILLGGDGADVLAGGPGDDLLIGGSDFDRMTGGAGADIFAFDIVDYASGDAQVDRISDFESGIDKLHLAGLSVLSISEADFGLVLELGENRLILLDGLAASDLEADDVVEAALGYRYSAMRPDADRTLTEMDDRFITISDLAITLDGLDGDDLIVGGENDDILEGGPGGDVLLGAFGDDLLRGGPGFDNMTGGDGADEFVFTSGEDTDFSADVITDFELGTDTIVLEGYGFDDVADLTIVTVGEFVALQLETSRFVLFEGIEDTESIRLPGMYDFI